MSEVNETPPVVEAPPERPPWLPEKFRTPEDMAKSYTELEQAYSKKAAAGGNADLAIGAAPPPVPETEDEALAAAGVNEDEIAKAIMESGKPSDEQYEKFKKAGFPKYVVDRWVQARVVLAERVRDVVLDAAGGEDGYKQLTQWAAANASKASVDAFNKAIKNGTPDQAREQVELMQYRYSQATGAAGSRPLVSGKPAPGQSGGFASYEEKRKASEDVSSGKMEVAEYNRRFAATDPKFYHPPRRP